jgi:hypothetical protein
LGNRKWLLGHPYFILQRMKGLRETRQETLLPPETSLFFAVTFHAQEFFIIRRRDLNDDFLPATRTENFIRSWTAVRTIRMGRSRTVGSSAMKTSAMGTSPVGTSGPSSLHHINPFLV